MDIYVENGKVNILCIRSLDKIPNSEKFIICRGNYPAKISLATKGRVQDVAQKIVEAFGLVDTPMLIQMKINDEQIHILEFCARTGGGIKYRLLPKVCGFDAFSSILLPYQLQQKNTLPDHHYYLFHQTDNRLIYKPHNGL